MAAVSSAMLASAAALPITLRRIIFLPRRQVTVLHAIIALLPP
jgi:hypothetical protein